jgi:dissimilatory sulfite reductase (desulfoviridin) alpha/beta subunit
MTEGLKDFEDKLNINPDFFGLFRDEILNMSNQDNLGMNIVELSEQQKNNFKEESYTDIIKIKEPIKNHIVIDGSSIDDLKTKDELLANNTKNICSSTTINTDELKNIKLDKYEIYKLEEIIKYFVNISKN